MEPDQFQRLLLAASFASTRHRDQVRADGVTPYISHVFRVMLILRHHFGVSDDDLLITALLHDTLEDTATDYEELSELFGQEVAANVAILTKNPLLPKRERESDYKERLRVASEGVRLAKLADVYDNLSGRIGTAKMPRTVENAMDLTALFEPLMTSEAGKRAILRVRELLERLAMLPAVSPSAKTLPNPIKSTPKKRRNSKASKGNKKSGSKKASRRTGPGSFPTPAGLGMGI